MTALGWSAELRPPASLSFPRRREIRYAAAHRLNHTCPGVLDRPVLVRNCALAGR